MWLVFIFIIIFLFYLFIFIVLELLSECRTTSHYSVEQENVIDFDEWGVEEEETEVQEKGETPKKKKEKEEEKGEAPYDPQEGSSKQWTKVNLGQKRKAVDYWDMGMVRK